MGIEKRVSRIGAHSWQGLIRRRTSRISKWVSVEKLSASGSGRDSNWQTAEGAKGYVRSKREEGLREAGASVSGSPALGSVENSDTDPISNQNPNPNPVQSGFARHADSATQLLEAVRLGRPLDWESRRSWNGMQKGVSGAGVRSQANPVAGEASTSGGAVGEPAGLPNRAPVGYELVMRGTKKPPGGSPILGRSKLGTSQPLDYRNASASMQNESPEGEGVSAEARGPAEASLSSAVSALNLNPAPNPVVNRVPRPDAIANPARNQVLNPASNPVRRKWEELLPETPKLLKPDTKPQKSLAAVTPALSSAAEKQEDSRRKWERELAPPPAGPPPPPPQKIQKSRLAAILSGESNAPERDSSSQGDGSERGLLRGGGGSWEDSPPPRQGLHFFKDGIEFTEVDPEVKERQIAEWLSQSGVAGRRRGEESLTGGESRFGDGFGTGFESGSESGSEGNSEKSSLRKWRVSQNGFAGAQRGVENGPSPGNGEPESGFSPRSRSGSHKNPGAEFRDERPQTRRQYGQAGRGPSLDFRGEAVSGLEENARIERPGERRRAGPSESGLSPGSRRDPESESNKVNREMGAERRRQSEPSESRSSRGSIDGLASGPLEEYRGEGVASPRQPRRLESGFRRRVDSNAEGIFEGDGLGGKQTGESRRSGPGSGQWESDSWQGLAMEVDEESSASGPSQEAHKR